MAKWHPANESPTPDEWFVRELKLIDPKLRVVWGMERYFRAEWAIERKMEAEEYWLAHASLMAEGGPRFVDQPIYDHAKPIKDLEGNVTAYEQVGVNKYDLAPEYEYIAFRPSLDGELITLIKKLYWENAHKEDVARQDKIDDQEREKQKKARRMAAAAEGIEEALLETRKIVQFGHGQARSENEKVQ